MLFYGNLTLLPNWWFYMAIVRYRFWPVCWRQPMVIGYLCVLNHAPPGQDAYRPTPEQMQRCCLYLEQYDSQFDLSAWGVPPEVERYGLPLCRYLRKHCPPGQAYRGVSQFC